MFDTQSYIFSNNYLDLFEYSFKLVIVYIKGSVHKNEKGFTKYIMLISNHVFEPNYYPNLELTKREMCLISISISISISMSSLLFIKYAYTENKSVKEKWRKKLRII